MDRSHFLWMALGVALLLAAGCSEPEPSKSTFMGLTEGARLPVNRPQGLNPLGDLPVCQPGDAARPLGERVLVARPDRFTREASLMISALRQALADEYGETRSIEFLITNSPIQSGSQAAAEGQRCGALIVFWETYGSRNLELTVPQPARIPLKEAILPQVCEFGSYQDQLRILYLTVSGLLAMLDHHYDIALYDVDQAKRIDTHCLQVPSLLGADSQS